MDTALTTGSIMPLSAEITRILYGLIHRGTRSCSQMDCEETEVLGLSSLSELGEEVKIPLLPILVSRPKSQ